MSVSFEDHSEKGKLNPDGLNDPIFQPAPRLRHQKGNVHTCFNRTTGGKRTQLLTFTLSSACITVHLWRFVAAAAD